MESFAEQKIPGAPATANPEVTQNQYGGFLLLSRASANITYNGVNIVSNATSYPDKYLKDVNRVMYIKPYWIAPMAVSFRLNADSRRKEGFRNGRKHGKAISSRSMASVDPLSAANSVLTSPNEKPQSKDTASK